MRKLLAPLLVLGIVLPAVSSCVVHTRPRARACAYGYHWNGRYCVANHHHHHHPRRVIVR